MSNNTSQPSMPTASSKQSDAELYSFLNFREITKLPCFRESALWSIGTGSIMGLFQYTRTKNILSMLNYIAVGSSISGIGSYYLCRSSYKSQRNTVRFYMNNQDQLKQFIDQQRLLGKTDQIQTSVIQPEITDDVSKQNAQQLK